VCSQVPLITGIVAAMAEADILTSLFIDPDPKQLEAARATAAAMVELHTGAFANAFYGPAGEAEAKRLEAAAQQGQRLGLTVNMGHGINYVNIARVRGIPGIHEMNIGHSILARALFTGIREAVREMRARMNGETAA